MVTSILVGSALEREAREQRLTQSTFSQILAFPYQLGKRDTTIKYYLTKIEVRLLNLCNKKKVKGNVFGTKMKGLNKTKI